MPTIAILACPNAQALDITGPMDVFAEANRFLAPAQQYQLTVLGMETGPLVCSNGLQLLPAAHYAAFDQAVDLLLVAGGPSLPGLQADPALNAWLQAMDGRCGKIASVCTGAFLLAHAGLLDGRRATTHWNDVPNLAARFPRIAVQPDHIFVRDGRVYTSAGVTAGIDLALYLLFEDAGPEVSLNVAKRLVVFTQRSGGQSQFSPYLAPYVSEMSVMQDIQQFVLGHLREALPVTRLAGRAAMSERHFSRVFAREMRMTPGEFIERARVDAARVLLETDGRPLKTIAHDCGFASAARLRAAFLKHLGVSAHQYRQHFGAFTTAPPGA